MSNPVTTHAPRSADPHASCLGAIPSKKGETVDQTQERFGETRNC